MGEPAGERPCAWCGEPIRPAARRDAKTCSKSCRQAKHRFRVGPAGATAATTRLFAYADPPYPGLARKYYDCDEVDHEELIAGLVSDFPDGWALSTSSKSLQMVLGLCPNDVRVAAWVFGARQGVSWRPRSSWEPLIVAGGRPRRIGVREYSHDALLWGGRQSSHPGALVGMKPAAFCEWMFRQLGAMVGDELVDLFPGSGAISRAWGIYTSTVDERQASGVPPRRVAGAGGDVLPRGSRDTSCLAGAERRLQEVVARAETGPACGDDS